MSDHTELLRAFYNMKLYTQDHLITTMRSELREGVLEAIQIFEKEMARLRAEKAELEIKLGHLLKSNELSATGFETRQSHSFTVEESIKNIPELGKPTGPIDIGRPYPVYVICYICNQRVLTKTVEKTSGGFCLNCLTESPPITVLHSCPICHTFLGIYCERLDDES